MNRRRLSAALAVSIAAAAATPALARTVWDSTGPNTSTTPYVIPVADGVHIKSLLTVDDDRAASDGYEMVGIPDGLGAYKRGRNDFTLMMNHELRSDAGVVRRHGQKGAFVSSLEIDRRDFEVEEGRDTIDPGVRYWDYVTQTYQATASTGGPNPRSAGDVFPKQGDAFARFCSGTLSAPGQFDTRGSRGYSGQIYFANEENGDEGRVFGVLPDGRSQQLPRLGLFSWENTKPAYNRSDTTLVMGNEDTAAGQMWVYDGVKRSRGNAFDRAGLTNGSNTVLDLVNEAVKTDAEFRTAYGKGKPAEFDLSDVDWDQSGARQNTEATAEGLTLNRIEDGAWDPRRRDTYYFLTTEGGDKTPTETGVTRDGGGLWKIVFEDIERPRLGGTIELLLDGSEAPYLNKPDNLEIDTTGNLLIQEDPGNNAQLARIVAYSTTSGERGVVARFDPARFRTGAAGFITQDEESSGIIDAKDVIGPGWFVFDAQIHTASPNPASVEPGQLLVMKIDDIEDVYDLP